MSNQVKNDQLDQRRTEPIRLGLGVLPVAVVPGSAAERRPLSSSCVSLVLLIPLIYLLTTFPLSLKASNNNNDDDAEAVYMQPAC